MSWPTSWSSFLSLYKWLKYPFLTMNEQIFREKQNTSFWFFFCIARGLIGLQNDIRWWGLVSWPLDIYLRTLILRHYSIYFWLLFSWFQSNKWDLSQNQQHIGSQHKKLSPLMWVRSCFVNICFSSKNLALVGLLGKWKNHLHEKSLKPRKIGEKCTKC
jgi:hypothetical protein